MKRTLLWAVVGTLTAVALGKADDIQPAGFRQWNRGAQPCQPCQPSTPLIIPQQPGNLPPVTDPTNPNPNPTNPDPTNPNPNPANPNQNPNDNSATPQQREAGGQPYASFNASMFGDFPGIFYTRFVQGVVPVTRERDVQVVSGFTERVTLDAAGNKVVTQVPVVTTQRLVTTENEVVTQQINGILAGRYTGIRIAENDSPKPRDRIYGGLNYFDDLNKSLNAGSPPISQQQQTVGFEKTLLDGDASIGMRLPFIQVYGLIGRDFNNVGDLSIVGKYAFVNDRETGNVRSAGLILTVPTGTATSILTDGTIAPHSTLFQPWVGFVQNSQNWYSQGFSSIVVPTDGRDPTILFNSIGFGYWAYRASQSRFLTAVLPIAEFHVTTPLSNRDPANPIYLQDQLNITTGSYFFFGRAAVGLAVNVPTLGPRPWNIESIVNFNLAF